MGWAVRLLVEEVGMAQGWVRPCDPDVRGLWITF